jgi:hypothetical protein
MATTGVNFVEVVGAANAAFLNGTAVTNTPFLVGVGPAQAIDLVNATPSNPAITAQNGICVDRVVFDLALTAIPPGVGATFIALGTFIGGYAKNGAVLVNFTGTNAQTLNLTNTALVTPASSAGDSVFANVGCVIVNNLGAAAVTLVTTGANGAILPSATNAVIAAGSFACYHAATQAAVDATHKNIVITPANTTTLAISIGGS